MANAADGTDSPEGDEMKLRVGRLSAGQLECLRLVGEHLSSKEIAAQLNISPHTVDQRVRQALQTLGVERRAQAARLVAKHDGSYQRLIHQAPDIDRAPEPAQSDAAVGIQIRHADRAGGLGKLVSLPSRGPHLTGPPCNRHSPRGATPGMR